MSPLPFIASLLLTMGIFPHYQVSIDLVFSIHYPTEIAIQKMIDASQGIITIMNSQGEGMSPPMKKHLELEIKTLENAPKDAEKLELAFENKAKAKRRSNADGRHTKVSYRRD